MGVDAVVELLGYDPYTKCEATGEPIGYEFEKVMEPVRNKWFELIDSGKNVDSGDLEKYAKKLFKKVNSLMVKLN